MAISVNPATFVITIPEADLTLIQSVPTLVYELELNEFRLWLKDWEDNTGGIIFLKTNRHNTEVSLGGLIYARTIEILTPYTITFEDGLYSVNLVGANSNVGDRVNKNQVSVNSNNSAGLISNAAIEYSSFNGGVTIDAIGGVTGTLYNRGTPENPVNNVPDAVLIATTRGFNKLYVIGSYTFDTGDNLTGFKIIGESEIHSTLTINTGATTVNCLFTHSTITGVLDGGNVLEHCKVTNLNYFNGAMEFCSLEAGTITLAGGAQANIINCWSGVAGSSTPIIDMGGSGQSLALRNYNGGIKLTNKAGVDEVSIDFNSGQLKLSDTVTNGKIIVRGVGDITENLSKGATIMDAVIDSSGIIKPSGGLPRIMITDG